MNELDLLMNLRNEIPLTKPSEAVEDQVLAAIGESASSAARSDRIGGRRSAWRAGAAGIISLAVAREPVGPSPIPWSGRPTALSGSPEQPSLGTARTEAQLVDYATRAAIIAPGHAPSPHEWVFVKDLHADSSAGSGRFLFGPPDKRILDLSWNRVDWLEWAGLY